MEQDFQTSFIPKKPMIENRTPVSRPIGLLTIVSIFIFFTVILATGALYFYKGIEEKNLASMQDSLNAAKNRFEPSKIAQLQVLDKRLKASTEVLDQHIAITPIFSALEDLTMKSVRYTKFSYTLGDGKNTRAMIQISGVAVGYRSIALQSDLFAQNLNIIDPVFSNLSLDDKGNVVFDLSFAVDPNFLNYKQVLKTQAADTTGMNSFNNVLPPPGADNTGNVVQ